MNRVIVVVGPTSVGKTKLGVELAKAFNGEVISGDSMQIYRHMDIGTAKVTYEEMDGIVHHCIDIKDIDEEYSVSEFQTTVRNKIDDIISRNKTPIIVGGTGLYIKAALYDYKFNEEKRDHQYEDMPKEELYPLLCKVDEKSAKTIHPNNYRRIIRALQMASAGKKKSEILETQQHIPLYDICMIGLTLPRDLLYERINKRVDVMVSNGLIEEFNHLIELGAKKEYQSMKAIGYQEFFQYEQNEAIEMIKQHSRQYAKRQYTWFKNQFELHWIETNLNDFNVTVKNAIDYVNYGSKNYKYVAFKHQPLSMVDGIIYVKEGYAKGDIENPKKYDIYNEVDGTLHLMKICYDASKIDLMKIQSLLENKEVYTKKLWNVEGIEIKQFYEM